MHQIKGTKQIESFLKEAPQTNDKGAFKLRRLSDGAGLFLLVNPNKPTEAPAWRFEFQWLGKPALMSFGTFPKVSLDNARDRARAAHDKLAATPPVDPREERRELRKVAAETVENLILAKDGKAPVGSFEDVARKLHAHKVAEGDWKTTRNADQWLALCENYWFPAEKIGKVKLSKVSRDDLRAVIDHVARVGGIKKQGPAKSTAKDLREIANAVFVFGREHADKYCEHNVVADIPRVKVKTVSHPQIKRAPRLGELLRNLRVQREQRKSLGAYAQTLNIMLFQRATPTVSMEWSEISWHKQQWLIPGAKMKSGVDHIVTLPRQAIDLLREVRAITGKGQFVFPSRRRAGVLPHMDRTSMANALVAAGFPSTEVKNHSSRVTGKSMMLTLHADKVPNLNFILEMNMQHVYEGAHAGTYTRADMVALRVPVMQLWADTMDKAEAGLFEKEEAEAEAAALAAYEAIEKACVATQEAAALVE